MNILIKPQPITLMNDDCNQIIYKPVGTIVDVSLDEEYVNKLFKDLDKFVINGYKPLNSTIKFELADQDKFCYICPSIKIGDNE